MFPWQYINNIEVGHIRSARTDKKEDEDGNNHHEWSVSIEGNSLDDTRFEDFIPPIFFFKKKHKWMKSTEGKQIQYGKPLLLAWLLFSNVIISTLSVLQTLNYVFIIISWNDSRRWTNKKTFQRHFGFIISTLPFKKIWTIAMLDMLCIDGCHGSRSKASLV